MNRKKTAKQAPAVELSRSQLDEVVKILKDVGSVELKMVAPMHTHRATIGKPHASNRRTALLARRARPAPICAAKRTKQ